MKNSIFNKSTLIIFAIIFLFCGKAYTQNIDELYQKIDLFSEVLEKIQKEYVDERSS